MYKILITFLLLGFCFSNKIDINTATTFELKTLELNDNQINSIINYRNKVGIFNNIYELLYLSDFTINDIHAIQKFVSVIIPTKSIFEKDMEKASYKMGKWISNEGRITPLLRRTPTSLSIRSSVLGMCFPVSTERHPMMKDADIFVVGGQFFKHNTSSH